MKRSYNEQLFPQAVEVLNRINYPSTKIQEFVKLTEHIKVLNGAFRSKGNILYCYHLENRRAIENLRRKL